MTSSQDQEAAGFSALDEVFENFGPVEFDDVVAFIDSQFDRALCGEEEIFCSNPLGTAKDGSKIVVDREDRNTISMSAALNSFEFMYGSDTQINFMDGAISLSPQEETKRGGLICSRCRQIVGKDDFDGCYGSGKITTTREAASKKCAGDIELKETSPDPRNAVVTELQLSDISEDVGTCWRVVGTELHISASKIHNLNDEYQYNRDKASALLMMWKQQKGSNATVGRLADVLEKIGKKSIAEKLLGESKEFLPTCETVSDGEMISLKFKFNIDAGLDGKLMLCEDTHGNKFIVKPINDSDRPWNLEEIQKNKEFLETVAAAAKEMGKTVEQRRQESLKRISSEVQELRQQLKRVKLDCSDTETCAGNSDPIQNTKPLQKDQKDAKMSSQDVTHLLHSCEEQHTFCLGIYNALIHLIGEVAQLGEENSMCIKQLYDFTKELKEQGKTFLPKIEVLNNVKEELDKSQAAQVEELEKWSRAQKEQVQGVERLLSSLLYQGKTQKILKRRSEPVIGVKPPHGHLRRRTKTDSSKSSGKSQSLSELPGADKKFAISGPVCVRQLNCLDTDKKLKSEKDSNYIVRVM